MTISTPNMDVEIVASEDFAADVEKCSEIHDENGNPLPPVRDDDGWI